MEVYISLSTQNINQQFSIIHLFNEKKSNICGYL